MTRNKSNILLSIILLILCTNWSAAQYKIKQKIHWTQNSEISRTNTKGIVLQEDFSKANFTNDNPLPNYVHKVKLPAYGNLEILSFHFKSEPLDYLNNTNKEISLATKPMVKTFVQQERRNFDGFISFVPIVENQNGKLEKITEFEMTYSFNAENTFTNFRGPEFKSESALRNGDIYKLAIPRNGLYKITFEDLQSFEIDPNTINPKNIQIYGNPGGPNPEPVAAERYDDLIENSIFVSGEADNSFDEDDFIIFYGYGPNAWELSSEEGFTFEQNIYDDRNYYFLKIGNEEGKRIVTLENEDVNINASSIFDDFIRYEKDQYNLLGDFESAEGSGQIWFTDKFKSNRTQDYSTFFSVPNLNTQEDVKFKVQFASRSSSSSNIKIKVNGEEFEQRFNGVSVSNIESNYVDSESMNFSKKLNDGSPSVILDYPLSSATSVGWLDYIQMEYKSNLVYNGQPLEFRDIESEGKEFYKFRIKSNPGNYQIWDITDVENILNRSYKANPDNIEFAYPSAGIQNFILFEPASISQKVEFKGQIENQNLHAITNAELVVLYHPDFEDAANSIASHRASHDDLNVITIPIQQVFHEFSSGKVDPTAIRNFARMLYTRDPSFNYLLLIGDGSYDYKHIRENEYSDENFVPVYETKESFHPIKAFPTDDFYALLDLQEGNNLRGGIDIAVGRLPVRNADEANAVVNKLINYDTNSETYGDWRLRIAFASDDEDNNLHFRDADKIAEEVSAKAQIFNQEKIYFDAFPQIATPGGERYPQATESINNNIFKGMLTLCYLGHGGPKGWAQERVLKLDDIEQWDNENKLPLLVTATCSFTGFDDPKITSAGESVLLKEKGGAVGLFTTVRAVYASSNKRLTQAVFDTIFTQPLGQQMRIGEVLRRAKNSNKADTLDINARKFLLIGDPSMKLATPRLNIATTSINGQLIDQDYQADTIKALQKMQFEGHIENEAGGIKEDFNGTAFCSVFDKSVVAKTLGNNPTSNPAPFNIQKTVLFKGQAKVINGKFNFEFYLPADINFEYGKGKISLYAHSDTEDAKGKFDDFYIGGSEPANSDDNPPLVDVFLNTEDFAFGGVSTSDPVLLVKLADDFGINVSGVSVGHDLIAELDEDSKQRYVLNDFYEADINNFRNGTVKFPLKDLAPGKHSLKVKAWDLSNNLGEGYTEFIVTDDLGESLQHVLNYPNPFSTRTNFQFEHNLPGTELEILINIYNMSGQIVKTIERVTVDDGFRIDDITWNGNDDFDNKIANGVYLYKIKVRANQLGMSKESSFEKLVILK